MTRTAGVGPGTLAGTGTVNGTATGSMSITEAKDQFLAGERFAVAGASNNPRKFGNAIFQAYQEAGFKAYPINPNTDQIEGHKSFPNIEVLSRYHDIDSLSVVTPPEITKQVVKEALDAGVKNIWMQPGAEHPEAIKMAQDAGANVIFRHCVLRELQARGL